MRKFLLIPAFAFMSTAAIAQQAADGPGPNMVIEVAAHDGTSKGRIVLDLLPDVAPNHVERLVTLARDGKYDGVVFHRVIDGFMAQTGDVQYGRHDGDTSRAGMGGSDLPDLKSEFSDLSFQAGTVGMARSQSPDSANSQFFIDLAPATFLDGQYTIVGQLIEGADVLNSIKKGDATANGAVSQPDYMSRVTIEE
ncbi:MAG: peptidylprolyl isomerase [Paracoccus sp. (in: a-proteobacteria)]|nr:peptidylprolyl isomerase [Paracoccus sp. (in: a-proteobacteria)]